RLSGAVILVAALLVQPWTDGVSSEPRLTSHARVKRAGVATDADAPFPAPDDVASAARRERHDVPLSGTGKHLIVDGTLNGTVSGPMLVDTGASYCVVTRGTAERLGLGPRSGRTIPVVTANGQVDAAMVEIDAVQLSGARLAAVDAVIMDAV